MRLASLPLFVVLCLLANPETSAQQQVHDPGFVAALKKGGFVIVMRHASSPREVPSPQTANPDNTRLERQLDAKGRQTATAMGDALRRLAIPIAEILSSPTYRAMETVRFTKLTGVVAANELGDQGQSMQGIGEAEAAWLRNRAAVAPRTGNTLLVTHSPNLARAFPEWGSSVADGESAVLRPDGRGGAALMARIKIEEWPTLASLP